jgi:hypothetical protein
MEVRQLLMGYRSPSVTDLDRGDTYNGGKNQPAFLALPPWVFDGEALIRPRGVDTGRGSQHGLRLSPDGLHGLSCLVPEFPHLRRVRDAVSQLRAVVQVGLRLSLFPLPLVSDG